MTALDKAADALEEVVRAEESGMLFDLIVADLEMPEMEGLMLARAIRTRDTGRRLPILFCGKSRYRETPAEIKAIEHSACLLKPIRPLLLLSIISRLLAFSEQPAHNGHATDVESQQSNALCGRVLVAEDNITNQRVVILMLNRMGLRVDAVGNGREAVEATRLIPYDLVFMDCQMPDMDGFAATRMIRDRESGPCEYRSSRSRRMS